MNPIGRLGRHVTAKRLPPPVLDFDGEMQLKTLSDSTILLSFTPILRKNTLDVVRGIPPLLPFSHPHERTCGSTLFRIPPCREGTIRLQTSMPSRGFEPRPYGIAISMTNHYTGRAAKFDNQ
ncbi:hypothetical protein TNCV_2378511 [Trichonephila clavipes]|nr:hypothetical protein TNCV_2378511 [Trichonephila clavipes]